LVLEAQVSLSSTVRVASVFACTAFLCTLGFTSDQKSSTKLSELPAEARWGVSAALGNRMPEYRARAVHHGYEAANPMHKLSARFDASGSEVQIEGARVSM